MKDIREYEASQSISFPSEEKSLQLLRVFLNRGMARTVQLKEAGEISEEDFIITTNLYLSFIDEHGV